MFCFSYASELAKKRGLNTKPSLKWWRAIKERHPELKLRKPEATASVRHDAMNPNYVTSYFNSLKSAIDGVEAKHIWNLDETGFTLSHTPSKIVAK